MNGLVKTRMSLLGNVEVLIHQEHALEVGRLHEIAKVVQVEEVLEHTRQQLGQTIALPVVPLPEPNHT